MALTPSGAISLGDINTALGRSATASININDGDVRFLANQDSGSVTMNNMRNKYWFNGTITSAAFFTELGTAYGIDTFNGSSTGGFNGYSNLENFFTVGSYGTQLSRSVPYTNIGNGRMQVGANVIGTMVFDGYAYNSVDNEALILSSDDGVTRTWRWATV
jgi:hypothetical protein